MLDSRQAGARADSGDAARSVAWRWPATGQGGAIGNNHSAVSAQANSRAAVIGHADRGKRRMEGSVSNRNTRLLTEQSQWGGRN